MTDLEIVPSPEPARGASAPPALSDPAAFAAAYARHAPRAYAAARAVLDHAAAEDVVQDVFAALWARPGAYDSRRGPLGAYVGLMARSRAVDRWRSAAAGTAASERLAARERGSDHAEDPAHEVAGRDGLAEICRALRDRPVEQRRAVLLAHVGGLTHEEIAAATAVPVGTVKSRVRLCLAGAADRLAA